MSLVRLRAIWITNHPPSVLTCKNIISEMTVSNGTLNLAQPITDSRNVFWSRSPRPDVKNAHIKMRINKSDWDWCKQTFAAVGGLSSNWSIADGILTVFYSSRATFLPQWRRVYDISVINIEDLLEIFTRSYLSNGSSDPPSDCF